MNETFRDNESDVDQHHYTPAGQVGAVEAGALAPADPQYLRTLARDLDLIADAQGRELRPNIYRHAAAHMVRAAAALDATTARAAAALEIVGELAESELVDEDENTVTCLYCSQTMLRGLQVTYIAHRPDCVYLRARRLVGEEGE